MSADNNREAAHAWTVEHNGWAMHGGGRWCGHPRDYASPDHSATCDAATKLFEEFNGKADRLTEVQAELAATRAERDEARTALEEAATSLETTSKWKRDGEDSYGDTFFDLRAYAGSRATVARTALARLSTGAPVNQKEDTHGLTGEYLQRSAGGTTDGRRAKGQSGGEGGQGPRDAARRRDGAEAGEHEPGGAASVVLGLQAGAQASKEDRAARRDTGAPIGVATGSPTEGGAAGGGLTFAGFGAANRARCEAPRDAGGFGRTLPSMSVAAMALAAAGEMGEVCDGVYNVEHNPDKGITNADVLDEIGDTAAYLDLLAQRLGSTLADAIGRKWDRVSAKRGYPVRLWSFTVTTPPSVAGRTGEGEHATLAPVLMRDDEGQDVGALYPTFDDVRAHPSMTDLVPPPSSGAPASEACAHCGAPEGDAAHRPQDETWHPWEGRDENGDPTW